MLSGDVASSSAMSGSDSEGEADPRLSSTALNLEPLSSVLAEALHLISKAVTAQQIPTRP